MKIPKGLSVGEEYFDGWGSDHRVPVTIPEGTFHVDEKIFPLIKDLWERDIYTFECCDEGYVGIDIERSDVTLEEVREIVSRHIPSFMWLKHGGGVYAVWASYREKLEMMPKFRKHLVEVA